MPRVITFDVDVARKMIARGEPPAAIAEVMGCSLRTVYTRCEQHGLKMSKRGRGYPPDVKRARRIIDLHDRRGMSFADIGIKMGRRSDPKTPMTRQAAQAEYHRAKAYLYDEDVEDNE